MLSGAAELGLLPALMFFFFFATKIHFFATTDFLSSFSQ
jgi:hypothetical protein